MAAVGMRKTMRWRSGEAGVALLISLFALLLICVVGVALIMASGTESALTGNYRSATSVYYAALAGLEEGRGRILPKSVNNLTAALGLPPGTMPTIGPGKTAQVWYIINPLPGEPTDIGMLTLYPDNEYSTEFSGFTPTYATTPSVSSQAQWQGTPIYSSYKWVRVNALTAGAAQSMGVAVKPGAANDTPLYYDGAHLNVDSIGLPAMEITSLAVMPNGSQRMLQYVVAPITLNLSFPAALTLDGNNVKFAGAASNLFVVNGNDSVPQGDAAPLGNCPPAAPAVAGIGYTNTTPADQSLANITNGITSVNPPPGGYPGNYMGAGPQQNPSVNSVLLPPNWQTPSGLTALVQTIAAGADAIITPPQNQAASQNDFPAGMSAANPKTIVVYGDLKVQNWNSKGYGLLVVTKKLDFGPNDWWNGVVLVIGEGNLVSDQNGSGEFDGAVLVAKTVDDDGNLLPDAAGLGAATAKLTGGGNSVKYSRCWINAVLSPLKYKTLSFREITPPTP